MDGSWPELEGVKHAFARVGQARIHYVEAGRGEPLILLHGWPQHWWCYRHVIARLARHYRVICPDIRGLGWSDYAGDRYDLLSLAADLTGLMDALRVPRARLIGHDWGAAIGYTACLQWPERISRFVALAALTPWSAQDGVLRLSLRVWHVFAIALLGRLALRVLGLPRRALRRWPYRERFSRPHEAVYLERLRLATAERATQRYYANAVRREIPYFIRHAKHLHLRTPTLHLNGEHDPLTQGVSCPPPECAPSLMLELVPECGHFIAEEQPLLFSERVLRFLAAPASLPSEMIARVEQRS